MPGLSSHLVMEQFLTGDIWSVVNKHLKKGQQNNACIAYVTSPTLNLGKGDILICDASDYSIKYGMTSAKTLEHYHKKGVSIYSNRNLHSKFLFTNKFLVLGSANLSMSSAENLIESSVITKHTTLVAQAKAFFYQLIEDSMLLTSMHINNLQDIEVVKRPHKPRGKSSNVRKTTFGDSYWYISALTLKKQAYEKIKETVESTSQEIAKENNIDPFDIHFIRWKSKPGFTKEIKAGDQVILRMTNENKTRTYVYPPSTILKKEIKDGVTIVYYDNSGNGYAPITLSRFQKLVKKVLGKSFTNRVRIVPVEEVELLMVSWPTT